MAFVPPQMPQHMAQVGVGRGVAGIEFDGPAEAAEGLVPLACGLERIAQVVVGHGVAGVQLEGPPVRVDSLVQMASGP
jgi:hypothetical protein